MTALAPIRLRLSRAKGFDLQKHSLAVNGLPAVNCARPGPFGNPFIAEHVPSRRNPGWRCVHGVTRLQPRGYSTELFSREHALAQCVSNFGDWLAGSFRMPRFVSSDPEKPNHDAFIRQAAALRGKNLACWCKIGEPCHADVMLELANREAAP